MGWVYFHGPNLSKAVVQLNLVFSPKNAMGQFSKSHHIPLPESNRKNRLKIIGWKMIFDLLVGWSIFLGANCLF